MATDPDKVKLEFTEANFTDKFSERIVEEGQLLLEKEEKISPMEVLYPKLSPQIKEAEDAGYSTEEIRFQINSMIGSASKEGYDAQQINEFLGGVEKRIDPGKRLALSFTEGALASTIGKARTGELPGRFIPESFKEEAVQGAGTLMMDLPIYVLGGQIGGTIGAFGIHSFIDEIVNQVISDEEMKPEERASRVAEATTKGAILGTLMKGAGLLKSSLGRFIAEVETLAIAAPALEGELPTLNSHAHAALFIGGFKGFNATVRATSNILGKNTGDVRARINERAKRENITKEEAALKEFTEVVGQEAVDNLNKNGKIDTNKIETDEEIKVRVAKNNKVEKEAAKKAKEEIIEEKVEDGEIVVTKQAQAARDELTRALDEVRKEKEKLEVIPEVVEEVKKPTTTAEIKEVREARLKDPEAIAEDLDIIYNGVQEGVGEIPDTFLFTDTLKGRETTFSVENLKDVGKRLKEKRVEFGVKSKQQLDKPSKPTIDPAKPVNDKLVETINDTELGKLIKEQRLDSADLDSEVRRKVVKEYGEEWVEDFDFEVEALISEGLKPKEAEAQAFKEVRNEADPKVVAKKSTPAEKVERKDKKQLMEQDKENRIKFEKEQAEVERNRVEAERILTPELRAVISKASANPTSLTEADFDLLRPIGGLKRGLELTRSERGIIDETLNMDRINVDELIKPATKKGDGPEFYSLPLDKMLDFLTTGAKASIRKSRVASKDVWIATKEWTRSPEYHPTIRNLVYALHDNIERSPRQSVFIANELSKPYSELSKASKEKVGRYREKGDRESKVFKDEELLGLNEEEIAGYKAVRSTIDYMHGVVLREQVEGFFNRTITEEQISKFKNKEDAVKKSTDKFIKESYIEGYEPRYRFGRYIAHVTREKDGKTIHNEGVNTREEALEIISRFDNVGKDTGVIDTKRIPHESRELLAISNYLPAIERMMTKAGVKDVDAAETINLVRQQTAMGRLAKRKGISGYSKDLDKSLNVYINHFPTAMAKRFNADRFSKIIRNMNKEDRPYSKDLVDYFYGRKWTEGKVNRALRTGIYINYLALKPAFGILNFTQRGTMTQPWTTFQIREMAKVDKSPKGAVEASAEAWSRVGKAQYKELRLNADLVTNYKWGSHNFLKVVEQAKYLSNTNKHILKRLYRQGELKELRQLELTGGSRTLKYLDIFGFLSERSNRVHAALTASDLYKDNGMKIDAIERMSDRFVNRSQILYSKANRPKFARGKLAPIMMFKSYVVGYLNMMHTLYGKDKAAFANMVGNMVALGGLSSLPFYESEIQGAVDLAMEKWYGRDWYITKRKIAERISNNKAASMLVHGAPAALGIDASSMLSISRFVDSPVVDIARGGINLKDNLTRSDIPSSQKWRMILPSQGKKVLTFFQLLEHGTTLDKFGKPYVTQKDILDLPLELRRDAMEMYTKLPKEWSAIQKLEILLGLPVMQLNSYYKDVIAIRKVQRDLSSTKGELNRAYARALFEEDREAMDKIERKAKREKVNIDIDSIIGHLFEYQELKE